MIGTYSRCSLFLGLLLPAAAFAFSSPIRTRQNSISFVVRPSMTLSAHSNNNNNDQSSQPNNDPVLQLPLMESELASTHDDHQRIFLQERIEEAKVSAEFSVRKAQYSFYEAFSQRDAAAMANVWSEAADVRCVHPDGPPLDGPQAVQRSWGEVLHMLPDEFGIAPRNTQIDIYSGQTAVCNCFETIQGSPEIRVMESVNVYRREQGHWKMVLHTSTPIQLDDLEEEDDENNNDDERGGNHMDNRMDDNLHD